ncbi:unnamed protein product, partial [Oncorhynchus mykiss]
AGDAHCRTIGCSLRTCPFSSFRLRKNLKSLIIVHPSWFIRTLLALTKPFISSKFSQKIQFVFNLTDLSELVPMEYVSIPDCIKE